MDPFIGAALISGGADLLSNLFGHKSQQSANEQNFEYSQKLLQQQMDYNTEMWNKSNEYNTATQQRKRLEEAGLNPYLMLQGGNAGTASSALGVSPSSPQAQASRFDFSGIGNAVNSVYTNMVAYAQKNKLMQEAQAVQIDNEFRRRQNVAELAERWSRTKNNEAKTYLEREIRKQTLENMGQDFVNKRREEYGMQLEQEGIKLENNMKALQLENLPVVFKQEISLRAADYQLKLAAGQLTRNQAKHEITKDMLTLAQHDKVKLDKDTADRIADALVEKAQNEAIMSAHPDNPYTLGTMAGQVMFDLGNKFINNAKSGIDKHFVKPSKRAWKDTKRAFGLNF